MADRGGIKGDSSILKAHPNGGGLRTLLGQNNYIVHEAAFGSKVGEGTDVCHWSRKFQEHMDRILHTRHQDTLFTDGSRNRVVMFQSNHYSSLIESDGKKAGDPHAKAKTLVNYKAAYESLLAYFQNEPETLFIAVTASPLAKPEPPQGLFWRIFGRSDPCDKVGKRVRSFNNWLKNTSSGWLSAYPLRNVVVFDYYDVLTAYGASNWLRFTMGIGMDCFPNSEGNTKAAQDFIPFINRAMNRMGKQVSNFYVSTPGVKMSAA